MPGGVAQEEAKSNALSDVLERPQSLNSVRRTNTNHTCLLLPLCELLNAVVPGAASLNPAGMKEQENATQKFKAEKARATQNVCHMPGCVARGKPLFRGSTTGRKPKNAWGVQPAPPENFGCL